MDRYPHTAVDQDDPVPIDEQRLIDSGWSHPDPDLIRVCCNCESEMVERSCKLRCPNCSFFLSCSDFL